MDFVEDFGEKSYNNGKSWKSSSILRVKTKTLEVFRDFAFVFFIFHVYSMFLIFLHFSSFVFMCFSFVLFSFLRDSQVLCVWGSLPVTLVVLCGHGVTSYAQPPDRSQHECTVGIDRDPPVWHLHPGRVVEVPERQLSRT